MRLRERVVAVAAAAITGVSATLALGASPAGADIYQSCIDGEWCIYEHAGFGGDRCAWQGNVSDYTRYPGLLFGVNCNDIMSAYVNNGYGTYSWIRIYKHANYSEYLTIVPPRESGFGDAVSNWVGWLNDLPSSHTWGTL